MIGLQTIAGAIQAERISMPPQAYPATRGQWSQCVAWIKL